MPYAALLCFLLYSYPAILMNENFAATGNSRAQYSISSNNLIMGVTGRVIDTVSMNVDVNPWKDVTLEAGTEDETLLDLKEGFRHAVMGLRAWLGFCYGNSQSRYASEDDIDEACRDVLSRGILVSRAENPAFNFWRSVLTMRDNEMTREGGEVAKDSTIS